MTEDDLAQVRAALTDEVLARTADTVRFTGRLMPMRDVLMAALAPLVRPAPTCATCPPLRAALESIATDPHCAYNADGVGGMYGIGVADGHRCAANKARNALEGHTPRPSTPEGSASR